MTSTSASGTSVTSTPAVNFDAIFDSVQKEEKGPARFESDVKFVTGSSSINCSEDESDGFNNLVLRRQALMKMTGYDLETSKQAEREKDKEKGKPYVPYNICIHNQRIGDKCTCQGKYLTTEDLDNFFKVKKEKAVHKVKKRSQREKRIAQVAAKVEHQFLQSAMRDLVDKFANMMANKCVKTKIPALLTAQIDRMVRGLVSNMYWSLGMNYYNELYMIDYAVFETIAYVIVTMILDSNFQVHIYKETTKFSPDYYHSPDYYDYINFYNNLSEYQELQKCLGKIKETPKKKKKKCSKYRITCQEMKEIIERQNGRDSLY